jgi:uncharacterized membrane protein YdjX (TVP38/TMEM64 family)
VTEIISSWLHHFGDLTPVSVAALCSVFLLAAFVVFPRTLLIIAAGATFGLAVAPIILISGTAGGILAFSSSRYIAANWFRGKLATRPMSRAIAQAVDDEGWRIIALMRLGAPLPSAVQNYLFGLTNIGTLTYSITTLIFSAPQVSCIPSSARLAGPRCCTMDPPFYQRDFRLLPQQLPLRLSF